MRTIPGALSLRQVTGGFLNRVMAFPYHESGESRRLIAPANGECLPCVPPRHGRAFIFRGKRVSAWHHYLPDRGEGLSITGYQNGKTVGSVKTRIESNSFARSESNERQVARLSDATRA